MPARSDRGYVWPLLSAAAALIVFALLWLGYTQQWNGLSRLDVGALTPAHHYGIAHPGWVTAWDVFATALGPGAFRIGGAIIIIVLLVRGQRRPAVFLLVTIELSALVTELAKLLAGRPRPATKLVDAYGTSFPSGHALGIMVCVLALLTVFTPKVVAAWRPWLGMLGGVLILLIGVSRVLLNVHNPSDVLAGWALGYAYFIVCLLALPPWTVTAADGTLPAPGNAP
ncbi:phosphatase PAP2 family protein [Mycobacteroides abscessus]|uniref:phosphatase PAP2 family protein n=1 Tax=Mycobacteroides abscessus TaxID=36809 RepID=UPI0009A7DA74|nr:phosphatase PAP2 family protein [Mycobacteroides abscessus]MDO3068549.1 phosphatase PAP2 family protein [Mycobacteroides abscessus subsp. bolletii]SKN59909.1 phosphoesterase, PA-phosphatase-like protein [Mycobacteroides abscessus subsp. bolletii]SKX23617.1 phosphoesterase, PA-phosphatase-like protein [Mycobacteroides abscessus subsp. bolletii]